MTLTHITSTLSKAASLPMKEVTEKVVWRVAQGPPPEKNAPFRRTQKTYATVVQMSAPAPLTPPPPPPPPPAPKPTLSRGEIAFLKGGKFENDLSAVLTKLADASTGEPLLKDFSPSSAPAEEEDVIINWKGRKIGMEAKNLGTSEGGQRAFALINGKLEIPNLPRNRIHRACLPKNFVPFEGRIPSFKKGDLTRETWEKEWNMFRDQRIRCSPTAISDFYRMKGASYIQIQGMGLYHTGKDVCGWGVPLFQCPTQIRIRCKTHRGNVPTSVQAALNFNRQRLKPSPFCLFNGPLPSAICRI